MWIIPSSILESLVIAPDFAASKEELSERLAQSEPLLMWKSKPLSSKTFFAQCKRVNWMRHLSGQILKPSMQSHFETRYTASLEDIPASHLVWPEIEKEQTTLDTYGRILKETSVQSDLFGAFLKTSADTSALDSSRSDKAFQTWVIQLRQESLQRRKLARHIRESDYSSSPSEETSWVMPIAQQTGTSRADFTPKLHEQVKMSWPTPVTSDASTGGIIGKNDTFKETSGLPRKINQNGKDGSVGLARLVKIWPEGKKENWSTPQNRDYKSPDLEENGNYQRKVEKGFTIDLNSQVVNMWATPTSASSGRHAENLEKFHRKSPTIATQVVMKSWPTPTVAEAGNIPNQANYGQVALSNHPSIVGLPQREKTTKGDSTGGQQDRENHNNRGSLQGQKDTQIAYQVLYNQCGVYIGRILRKCWERKYGKKLTVTSKQMLNPRWVAQLMGTTLEKTFFVPTAMALLNKPQN